MDIKEVSSEVAKNIIQNRTPLGLFYTVENGVFVAIDNSDGNAWTEEFKALSLCEAWLKRIDLEPWEITQQEYVEKELPARHEAEQAKLREMGIWANNYWSVDSGLRFEHWLAVRKAVFENKPIPEKVLEEYPDLAAKPWEMTYQELRRRNPSKFPSESPYGTWAKAREAGWKFIDMGQGKVQAISPTGVVYWYDGDKRHHGYDGWSVLNHEEIIKKAIAEGKTIPEKVLKEYPGLEKNINV